MAWGARRADTGLAARPVAATRWNIDHFEWLPEHRLRVSGWAFGPHELREIVVMFGGRQIASLACGLSREDVAVAFPDCPGARYAGFEGEFDVDALGSGVEVIAIVARAGGGGQDSIAETSLLRRSIFSQAFRCRWSARLGERGVNAEDIFYFPIATSHVAWGGASGIKETFGPCESRTVRVGIRVQVLYLRTTLGAAADYVFDPDFVADKRCGTRLIAEDSLNDVIRHAVAQQMPVLFTLNGGIWADSACEAVDWDINDVLERDENLCQWNEKNQVMPDSALTGLHGSFESPELGRSLSLNIYMHKARFYKKRNLQQAATLIRRFADEHPDLFIGINLDPDVYINPFFGGTQWYDYNPLTLLQFRHWLRGDGPYAGDGGTDVPDLSAYRRVRVFTLSDIDVLAGKCHASWDEVDPPRRFSRWTRFWRNPWVAVWEQFRRHLVKLHYDELSRWVAEAGINTDRIYSSQGFMQPGKIFDPLPVRLDSPAKNYDTAGVSIEGAVPSHGCLGAIVYGQSAVNRIRMEGDVSLFAEFRQYSPQWAVVEYNTADLMKPQRMADYEQAYGSLRDAANYGTRFVSPMAWNGSPGEAQGTAGFLGYTALRRSPLEEAMMHFMLARADLPRHARLWTFGMAAHADGDGWRISGKLAVPNKAGALILRMGAKGCATLLSPAELAFRASDYQAIVVQATVPFPCAEGLVFKAQAQRDDGRWIDLCSEMLWHQIESCAAGAWVPIVCADEASAADARAGVRFQRIRLQWRGRPGAVLTVESVALYPRLSGTGMSMDRQ